MENCCALFAAIADAGDVFAFPAVGSHVVHLFRVQGAILERWKRLPLTIWLLEFEKHFFDIGVTLKHD